MLGNNAQYFAALGRAIRSVKAEALDKQNVVAKSDTASDTPNPAPVSSWESRSDAAAFNRFVVFSVGGILEANQFKAWALNEGVAFKALWGSWRGETEPSFIVEDTNENRLRLAYWVKGQKTLLCLGPAYRKRPDGLYQLFGNREAVLDWLEPDGYAVTKREPLEGLWQAVGKEQALALDSWTFDPTENQYYAVV